jgi:extradiol dioxygenase family protein
MRERYDVFHLAIPVRDLDEAHQFYVGQLGCKLARRYDDRITVDFFGDQLVCHLSEAWDRGLSLYPRHFGVTFRHREDFDRLLRLVDKRDVRVFQSCRSRFEGTVEEHLTFVLADPSNNLIEFKHYHDPRMMY